MTRSYHYLCVTNDSADNQLDPCTLSHYVLINDLQEYL